MPGETHLIEPARIVAVQARRQQLALPCAGRGLAALQLLDDAREPVGADRLAAPRGAAASRPVGATSSAAAAIAASASGPLASTVAAGKPRRNCTARARRSSRGASSRNAYGFALISSCDKGLGSTVSRALT